MIPTETGLLIFGIGLQLLTFLALLIGVARRIATKDDIKRLDDRIDALDIDMKARFAQQDAKFEARFEKQDAKFEARFEKQDEKIEGLRLEMNTGFQRIDERFEKQDEKLDRLRLETKADMQRLEDRLERANEYHARSVDLLDAIRRELSERREPL